MTPIEQSDIKALNTYKSCIETATALRKHFAPEVLKNIRSIVQEL